MSVVGLFYIISHLFRWTCLPYVCVF